MNDMILSENPLLLSVDTATPMQSLAILRGTSLLCSASVNSLSVRRDGPGLLSLLDAALKQCELKIDDIERFVVSDGPGAFTGVRVSMAMLKSFALTLKRPLYAASSLDALARDVLPSNTIVAACIDARRGEIYAAFYDNDKMICDARLLSPNDFAQWTAEHFPNQNILCIGSAFPRYTEKLRALNPNLICREAFPRAEMLARIVLEKYPNALPPVPLEALEPRYIRLEEFETPKPFDFSNKGQFRHGDGH